MLFRSADSTGTTPGTAPQAAKAVTAGGGDEVEDAGAAEEGAVAKVYNKASHLLSIWARLMLEFAVTSVKTLSMDAATHSDPTDAAVAALAFLVPMGRPSELET